MSIVSYASYGAFTHINFEMIILETHTSVLAFKAGVKAWNTDAKGLGWQSNQCSFKLALLKLGNTYVGCGLQTRDCRSQGIEYARGVESA